MDRADDKARDLFVQILGMDLTSAAILVSKGYSSLEEIAYVPLSELVSIEALQEPQLLIWRQPARKHLLGDALDWGGNGDDGEPQSAVVVRPLNPLAGGSGALIDGDEKDAKQ